MTIFKALKSAFLNHNHQGTNSSNGNGKQQNGKLEKGSNNSEQQVKESNNQNIYDEISKTSSSSIMNDDESSVEWPSWFNSIVNNNDDTTFNLISRNGLDDDNERSKKGFKGKNFVYQDRKFISKFYWKGKSSLVNSSNSTNINSNINSNNNSNNDEKLILPSILVNNNENVLDFRQQQFENRKLIGIIYWKNNCEGPPGCVHGGALASLFDDSMACCIRYFYNNNYNEDEHLDALNNNSNNGNGSNHLEINNLNSNSLSINNKFLSKIENNDSSIPNSPRSIHSNSNNNNSSNNCTSPNQSQTNYAVTANLSVNYKKFVDLESFTYIETKIQKRQGRKIFISSVMKDCNGVVRADATAVWIVIQIGSTSPNHSNNNSGNSSPNNRD